MNGALPTLPRCVRLLALITSLALCACQFGSAEPYQFVEGDESADRALLALGVTGPILGTPSDGQPLSAFLGSGVTYGYAIAEELRAAAERDDIDGVLLRFATPGGTIFGSQAIHDGVSAYREQTGNPVVAFVEGLSASGGVWAMAGADAIYADHGSMIGSIGVIGGVFRFYDKPTAIGGGLLGGGITTEQGIEFRFITAGRGKDYGNPFRRPSAEELAVAQQGVDNEYANFVRHVAATRNLDESVIRDRLGALIYDNATAQEVGLIDGTRSRSEAIEELAKLADVVDGHRLIRPAQPPPGLLARLFARADAAPLRREAVAATVARDRCAFGPRAILAFWGNPTRLCPSAWPG